MSYFTTKTLADTCGVSVRTIYKHKRAGTCRLDKAVSNIPGVGIRFDGNLAAKFIAVMQAKKEVPV